MIASAKAAGVTADVRRFPSETRTASDAARAVGCEVGQIVKSLVFVADGTPFIALTSGANRADPVRLATVVGAREVRRATPEEAREATGFAIGGTPPFGHPRPLRIVIDADLPRYEVLWAAAGAPDAVFPITANDLLVATGAEIADFKERT
ncbi:MAG: YbaK/EbsC family protein [Actinomycetota bacterium]|nr:YbaK/EbsC family protein [Actinomycetota bacterium]